MRLKLGLPEAQLRELRETGFHALRAFRSGKESAINDNCSVFKHGETRRARQDEGEREVKRRTVVRGAV